MDLHAKMNWMIGNNIMMLGILVILLGFILIVIGTILQASKTKTEGGFAVFIGPIPIVGATSKNMFYFMIVLSIILLVIFLLLGRGIFL